MDEATRINLIADAVNKVVSAGLGSFCNIMEKKEGKLMVVVENMGDSDKVHITVSGDVGDDILGKIAEMLGGMLDADVPVSDAPNLINKIFVEALGSNDFDIELELALE